MLSIIIKVYNEEKYISNCLLSVIPQMELDDELIIVNDGSTDSSEEIIHTIISNNRDKDIKYILKENEGPGSACNFGIKKSSKKYIQIIDGDDELKVDTLNMIRSDLKKYNPDILVFDIKFERLDNSTHILDNVSTIGANKHLSDLFISPPSVTNKIIKRDLIIKSNLLFPTNLIGEDLNFITKIYAYVNNYYYNPNIQYIYRERENSIITSNKNYIQEISMTDNVYDIYMFYKSIGKYNLYEEELLITIVTHGLLFPSIRIVKKSRDEKTLGIQSLQLLERKFNSKYEGNQKKISHILFRHNKKQFFIYILIKYKLYNILYFVLK